MRYSVIIPAGGSSQRFGTGNKLFQLLQGKPVFLHAVEQFRKFAEDQDIVIPVHQEFMEETGELLNRFLPGNRIRITSGGKDRTHSVINALELISPDCDLIAVHDAARPLISEKTIQAVYDAAAVHGAAAAARKSTNTLKRSCDDGTITSQGIDRESVWEIETPQTFRTELLRNALQQAAAEGVSFTDDSAAVEHFANCRTYPVIPNEINLKITHFQDIALAEALLRLR